MYFSIQTILCFLFIATFGNVLSVPLLQRRHPLFVSSSRGASLHRVRRQGPIVQPSWSLNSDISLFEDYNVRVTEEKLEETEAIRDYIQGTVDNGTYVVDLDEEDFEEEEGNIDEAMPSEELAQPGPELEVEVNPPAAPAAPEPKQPEPQSVPTPKQKPATEPKGTTKNSNFFSKFKTQPRRYSGLSGRPFFTWLRKNFTVK